MEEREGARESGAATSRNERFLELLADIQFNELIIAQYPINKQMINLNENLRDQAVFIARAQLSHVIPHV